MNKHQYIYVLKPKPYYQIEENWTDREEAIIDRHFRYLQNLLAKEQLVLAGKTGGLDEQTFGIVIFEAPSLEEAEKIMNNDPGVAEGVMTAVLFPYKVALMRE